MGWEFLASSGPTVVLMTNSEEHLGVPRSISSLGRLGTTADAMRPLISVSTSDGAPAKRVSESGSCHLHSKHSWMRCGSAATGMGLFRTDPEGNQSAQILHTPLDPGISSREIFGARLVRGATGGASAVPCSHHQCRHPAPTPECSEILLPADGSEAVPELVLEAAGVPMAVSLKMMRPV